MNSVAETTAVAVPPVNGYAGGPNGVPVHRLNDDVLYEIINGKRVEKIMSVYANRLASVCGCFLELHAFKTNDGRSFIETMFDLPGVNQVRRPDAAFVTARSWAMDRPIPRGDIWPVAPDLAIEIISPTNSWEEAMAKVREYFLAKVKLVWVVLPRERLVYVHTSRTNVVLLDESMELTGGDVLPTFRLPIAELFAKAGTEEAAS